MKPIASNSIPMSFQVKVVFRTVGFISSEFNVFVRFE